MLGDPSRFRILTLLREGERRVGEVADAVGLSQSCTTRHLQVLTRSGLVERTPRGREVRVALAPAAAALLAALTGADVPSLTPPARRSGRRGGPATAAAGGAKAPAPPAELEPPRADPPSSDTPPTPQPEPAAPSARQPLRSTLEDFLL